MDERTFIVVWLDQPNKLGTAILIPRRNSFPTRRVSYWLKSELVNLRSTSHRVTRLAQRAIDGLDQGNCLKGALLFSFILLFYKGTLLGGGHKSRGAASIKS